MSPSTRLAAKKNQRKGKKAAVVAAGELCPVKTEDVWLRGDSSNSKWLPFYKLGLCNKMRRGEYYQFSRLVKIAFLKPWEGWSLSREEPESVFLTRSQEGDGSKTCWCVRVCARQRERVFHWKRHPLRPLMPAGPALTEPRSIFLYPANGEKCRMQKNTHIHGSVHVASFICAHTQAESLGRRISEWRWSSV